MGASDKEMQEAYEALKIEAGFLKYYPKKKYITFLEELDKLLIKKAAFVVKSGHFSRIERNGFKLYFATRSIREAMPTIIVIGAASYIMSLFADKPGEEKA